MTVFYWAMGVLFVLTFVPAALYMLLYAFTGEAGCLRRASALWNTARVVGLATFNIGVWGHVLVAIWQLVF